ncbi:amino acid adenylation domain-containing protein, partial [Clostridium gasigenes]
RLLNYEDIKEVVVVAKTNEKDEKYLCAYYVSEKEINKDSLKDHLREALPEYMIPTYYIYLNKMPLTNNGKIDKRKLPEVDLEALINNEFEEPRNKKEEILVSIWKDVLGSERIGINDNFFELGGNSLKATVLLSKIQKELNIEIPLKELFKKSTIKSLSKILNECQSSLYKEIDKCKEAEYYETSSAQKRMYMLQQIEKGTVYNMPMVLEVEGELNISKITNTFNQLVKRHDALKTYFEEVDNEVVQKIGNNYNIVLEKIESDEDLESTINSFIRPFNLNKAPLFRVKYLEKDYKNYLLIDMHHIISDGVSMSVLMEEFREIYNGNNLEDLRIQYKDFAKWQNTLLRKEEGNKSEEYWLNIFKDEIPVLNLPYDYKRPVIQSFEGDKIEFKLDGKLSNDVIKLSKDTGTTVHMILFSIFNILLSKYGGQDDIVVGIPVAGREHADLENVMGIFVNTLTIRSKINPEVSYLDLLNEVKENLLYAYENESYQLEELIDKLNVNRNTGRNPLFDVMFNMINKDSNEEIKLDRTNFRMLSRESNISKFDLTLNACEYEESIEFRIEYCTKLFKEKTIKRLANHYINILSSIVRNNQIIIKKINLITEEECNKIINVFNNTRVAYPSEKTINQLFEEIAENTPDKIAVKFQEESLTYKELNKKANRIARVLVEKGIRLEESIGILSNKSIETIVGIIGILKAGGSYLAIDSKYPKERIEYMLKDSKARIVLIAEENYEKFDFDGDMIKIKEVSESDTSSTNIESMNTSNSLAYIMYSSGSTGQPKGILVEHKNIIRLVKNTEYVKFQEGDRILQTGAIGFDASTFEIWGALLNGLSLYLTKFENILSAELLEKEIETNNITILWLTSALFNQLAQENPKIFKSLRYLITGGERATPSYFNSVRNNCDDVNIVNGYGPTENTTFSTTYLADKDYEDNIPIGKPISNSTVYIVGKNGELLPEGIYGEIYVGGDGVARGYLNKEELTREKFIESPFNKNERLYKTGDIGRWREDGVVEYHGRIDNQIKLRGFRIELDEIESCFEKYKGVKEVAVVVKRNKQNEQFICAYYTVKESVDRGSIRDYLKSCLPGYMIPSYIKEVEKMHITTNGKIDKRLLPEIDFSEMINTNYEPPRTDIE